MGDNLEIADTLSKQRSVCLSKKSFEIFKTTVNDYSVYFEKW